MSLVRQVKPTCKAISKGYCHTAAESPGLAGQHLACNFLGEATSCLCKNQPYPVHQEVALQDEGMATVKELVQQEDWFCTIDLKDAYLSVAVNKEHRRYLRFMWAGKTF